MKKLILLIALISLSSCSKSDKVTCSNTKSLDSEWAGLEEIAGFSLDLRGGEFGVEYPFNISAGSISCTANILVEGSQCSGEYTISDATCTDSSVESAVNGTSTWTIDEENILSTCNSGGCVSYE